MEFKHITLVSEPYLIAQVTKHYSLCSYNQMQATVLIPGDWILLDKHFHVNYLKATDGLSLLKEGEKNGNSAKARRVNASR